MPTTEETKKVLEMLASGKIDVDQAQQLLDKLGTRDDGADAPPRTKQDRPGRAPRSPRHLRIEIQDPDGEQTRVRVPIGFARAGLKLGGMLPDWVSKCVVVNGVDLSDLTALEADELDELDIAVEGSDGERVRIHAE